MEGSQFTDLEDSLVIARGQREYALGLEHEARATIKDIKSIAQVENRRVGITAPDLQHAFSLMADEIESLREQLAETKSK
jgi:hypothetical protein